MQLRARYYDGIEARPRTVLALLEGTPEFGSWVIQSVEDDEKLARWPANALFTVPSRREQLRIGAHEAVPGARLVFDGRDLVEEARKLMPALALQRRTERNRQLKLIGSATLGLAGLIVAYLFGVPLLSPQITGLLPPDLEQRIGDTVAAQIEDSLAKEYGFEVCDPNPGSVANVALSQFVSRVVEGTGTPFDVNVTVARTDVPNAFALPGGRVYYFSALLKDTRSADEFAGVLSHEIGHVVLRHGMEQLVSSAGTGLLIGFILGDMTGLSLAGGLGAVIIDSRYSRDAERAADQFSSSAANRLGFDATALADLLDRVAEDDSFSTAMALLSSHPLTSERREALAQAVSNTPASTPVLSEADWRAIQSMCDKPE